MNLLKTSLLNGVAVGVKVTSALIINKILAVYVGPAGYAVVGQFQNAVSIIVNLAGGVVATGVTKTTAQHFEDEAKQHNIWKTAIGLSLIASIFAAVPMIAMSERMAQWLLHRSDMASVVVWMALSLPAIAVNNLLLAIINGKKEIGTYVTANIIGSILSLMIIGLLTHIFNLLGTLVALVISPALTLMATIGLISNRKWARRANFLGRLSIKELHELSLFALMGITSALASPISHIIIRDHITENLGLTEAGYWQASWKISEIYLMLVTTTLSVYYLPRIAEIKSAIELKAEIFKVYRLLLPIIAIISIAIYSLRDFIISMLFTNSFSAMTVLFPWQLSGDVIKIASWVLSFILLGRALARQFIITEIFFSISFVLLCFLLIKIYGLIGIGMAYAINYFIYLVCMAYLVSNEIRRMET